ncbi:7-carboxy-7-deazaguanine synthase QueE [Crateriforma spongiae]|uniref:7-carboxy-7-deazaguanine synthase QueE n=1 Tax=Crateriforma spongiae TaxID=2724528 RepID=UPI001447F65D|nr:7-carboxy-7-deazaguanine synthase QueE [Crateriforma spongiae]
MLPVAETFLSRQGEGGLTGTNSFFIRLSGCNLRCWFCDTPYASWQPTGQRHTVDELVRQAVQALRSGDCRHVVLTGGEPMIFPAVETLCGRLRSEGLHVTIETAGTAWRDLTCDLLSLSPKLSSSGPDPEQHPRWARLHEQRRMPIATMRQLIDAAVDHQVKFVVDRIDETDETLDTVLALGVDPAHVWIMPQGVTAQSLDQAAKWLRPWCDRHGFRYCDRMHIRWYGNRPGT